MAHNKLPDKSANDVLGPGTLNALRENCEEFNRIFNVEHNCETGEHNAYEVARVVRRITTTPTISPSSSYITAVTKPSTGRYVLTLASSVFTTEMVVQVEPVPETVKPYVASVQINSATEIEVFVKVLSSTLGSVGNSWAATDVGFDIAIYDRPIDPGEYPYGLPGPWARNASPTYGLAGGGSNTSPSYWSLLVLNQAYQQSMVVAAHTATGVHNVREVAQGAGLIAYSSAAGGKYVFDGIGSDPFSSYSRTSAGLMTITHGTYTAPVNAFVCADYERNEGTAFEKYIVNATNSSTTVETVYCYKYSTADSWWIADDCDFWISLHGV